MVREKKLTVCVINITTHPHSPESYVSLFHDAFKLRKPVKYRGDQYLILGKINELSLGNLIGYHGVLFRYVNISSTDTWLNTAKLEPVISEDGEPVVDIPSDMKPNCKMSSFIFIPSGHRMFFVSQHDNVNFSSAFTAKALSILFNSSEIVEKYGEVSVTVESTDETIKQILEIPSLTRLVIGITLPNDDDVSGEMKNALERMKAQKVKRQRHELSGRKEDGILPDDQTIALMSLARSNGYVQADGYDGEKKVSEKTSSHPVEIRERYDSINSSPWIRLQQIARDNIQKFIRR